ncbi:MAG: DUF721 domain-containing protein [Deltaproteobacteria bacterium]|nr:DUF721 domain-containing protein [Deltaproteobacteria bacterium]
MRAKTPRSGPPVTAKTGPVNIKDVLSTALHSLGFSARLKEYSIIERWPACVGEAVAKRCAPVRLVEGVLYCTVVSPAWITELGYQKKDIACRLNRELGEPLVKDIIFRLGHVEPCARPPARKARPSHEVRGAELLEIERTASVIKDDELREAVKRAMVKSREEGE